jgi:hypothetical protein
MYNVNTMLTSHPELNTIPPMSFRTTTLYRDCLSRQIGEALRILYSKDRILNSKSEYLQNNISRLTIEEDAWERKERSRQEEEQERVEKSEVEDFKRKKEGNIEEESVHKESPMTINASGPCQMDGINVLTGQTSVDNTVSTSTTIPLEEQDQTGSNTILEEESVQDGINMLTNKTSVGSVVTTSTTIPLEEQDQTGSNTILEEEPVQVESPMTITASGPCQMDGINVLTGQTPVGNFITTSTTIPLEEDPKKIKSVSIQPEKRFKARKVRKQRGCADYNLAYMKLWWARMDREGKKTEEDSRIRIQEKKQSDRMISFLTDGKLSRKSKTEDLAEKTEKETPSKLLNLSKISMNNVRMKAEGLVYFADVLKERHLCKDTPTVDPVFITGRGGV